MIVLAAAVVCLRLGWWQWEVTRSLRGTGQNLGYALLWPVFAISFCYMWLRFLHLENHRHDDGPAAGISANDATGDRVGDPDAPRPEPGGPEVASVDATGRTARIRLDDAIITGVGVVDVDDDDDPELAAYNRALARLAEQDERRGR